MITKLFTITPTTDEQVLDITMVRNGLTLYPSIILVKNKRASSQEVLLKFISDFEAEPISEHPTDYEYIPFTTNEYMLSEVPPIDDIYYKVGASGSGTVEIKCLNYFPVNK